MTAGSATMKISWHGVAVLEDVHQAMIAGIKEVGDNCVAMAKDLVNVDTGRLQESIEAHEPEVRDDVVSMEWGSFDVYYAIWQELNWKPYLRPAADACYPNLAHFISNHV